MFNHELYQKRFAPLYVGRYMSLYFVAVLCSEKASPWILPPNFESVNENLYCMCPSRESIFIKCLPHRGPASGSLQCP